ncbi:MAG: beta-lactamase [Gammaproteobacteria bacterium]|jgi:beta-lactamase class A|nr:beta-lactamase [Gammaproteobacteria bacterium]
MFKILQGLMTFIFSLAIAAGSAYGTTEPSLVKIQALETSSHGRLGVTEINTVNQDNFQYQATQRFPMGSTWKVMLVGDILKQSMNDPHLLQQKILYTKTDLDFYSPVTKQHLTDGMTIADLCAATLTESDNTAANLLMRQLGGPQSVTAFARSIGDKSFRVDRWEPALNSAIPGDPRDTTTPLAMAQSLQKLVFGNVLAPAQQSQLQTWLKQNTTGNARIRAGVPSGWIVGDKTGTGDYGTTNDIAVLWPPKGSPIILVVYFTQSQQNAAPRDDVIASVTRILIGNNSKL